MRPRSVPSSAQYEENERFNDVWISSKRLKHADQLPVSEFKSNSLDKADAEAFVVVWLKNVDRVLSLIPSQYDLSTYHFLDVGCGSGIATLYCADNFRFASYNGFDFEAELISRAEENLRIDSTTRSTDVNFFVANASEIALARQPWVLFLFNPFGARTLERFVVRNLPMLRATKSLLCYCNDKHIDYFDAAGFEVVRNDDYNLSLVLF